MIALENGVALPSTPPAAGGGEHMERPRIKRREGWADFPEEYEGFKVKLWLNFPSGLLDDLRSGEQARAETALRRIVLEHNGWCDEEGMPYPAAGDPGFWEAIPTEVAAIVMALIQMKATELPNSLLVARRR